MLTSRADFIPKHVSTILDRTSAEIWLHEHAKWTSRTLAICRRKPFEFANRTATKLQQVAVTATANEFAGIYRNKKQHEPDFYVVLNRALDAGVKKIMLTGMSLHDVDFNLNIARSRPEQCFITVGVHPYHAAEPEDEGPEYFEKLLKTVQALLEERPTPLAAFGELGLDYDNLKKATKEVQIRTFKAQLDMVVSNKINLPLFLHCRAAFKDFVEIIRPYIPSLPRGRLVHSFVGSKAEMQALVDMGLHVSVNGFSFRDEDSCEMVKSIPLDKLQIETDAPWAEIPPNSELAKRCPTSASLPPSKKKDKFEMGCMVKGRNESCMISQVACIVAGLKGISVEEVAKAAWTNSTKMFRMLEDEFENRANG